MYVYQDFAQKGNNPYIRQIPCGSFSGYGTAPDLAKLMGILANGGAHDGRTYISPGTTALLVEGPDEVMLVNAPYGRGTTPFKNPLVLACNAGTDLEFTAAGWGLGNFTREEATLISPNEMVTGCCIELLRASVMEPDWGPICAERQRRACDFAIDITPINTL